MGEPERWPAGPLRVVVLTCGDAGYESGRAIHALHDVEVVAIVISPQRRPRGIGRRLRMLYRRQGLPGLLAMPIRKASALLARVMPGRSAALPAAGSIPELHVTDFHSEEALAALRALHPDLAVIDGTYILRESVFALPGLGSINLHCGRLPQYRGAPPGFWELYNGEHEVGVTVHRVTAGVDEGAILQQAIVPLDPAPAGDPMRYLADLWSGTLRPIGVRLLADAVASIAERTAVELPQDRAEGHTYRFPSYTQVRELRRRIARRRQG